MSIKFVGNKSINKLISLIKNYIDESVKPLKGKNGQLIGFDENGDQIPVEIKIPSVSVTPTASSGTKVGTITIDGKSYDLYAPSVTTDSIGAANKSHNHNDIYYTESEIDNKLANKSNNGHTHDYAATNHSHSGYVQTSKITQSSSVTATGQYVLDAIEKNASIEGTLAHQIAQANSNLAAQEGNRTILVNTTCTGGTTQNCAILNNSKISDWRNLLFLFVTNKQILSSNFLDRNFFIFGYAQRIFWYDTSYLYYIDVVYISETMVQIKAVYPSSASLGLIIVGLN